jgi:inner membrane protein
MTGRTHAVLGANVVWITHLLGAPVSPWLLPLGALAALLPDLDASESMIKNIEVRIGSGRYEARIKPLVPLAMLFATIFRHRGWLHSWISLVVVGAASAWLFARFGGAVPLVVMLGYTSHLFADALTKSGIALFLPLKHTFHVLPKILRVRTGGFWDTTLFLVGVGGCIWIVVRAFGNGLLVQ